MKSQEKLKKDKSQKNWDFEKCQEKSGYLAKFVKMSDLFLSNLHNSLFLKTSCGMKFI